MEVDDVATTSAANTFCQFAPVIVGVGLAVDTWFQRKAFTRHKQPEKNGAKDVEVMAQIRFVLETFLAIGVYFISGPAVIMLNKYIMSSIDFPFPIFVANLGSVFLALLTRLGSRVGIWPALRADLQSAFLPITLPLSICGSVSLFTGNCAYLYLSVPLIQIMKTVTILLVMALGFYYGTERFSWMLVLSVLCIVGGIMVSVEYVPSTSQGSDAKVWWGFFLLISASVFEAVRTSFMQRSVQELNFYDSIYAGMLPNSLCGLLLSAILESQHMVHAHVSRHLVMCLLGSSITGGIVVLSNYWLSMLVGGLTMKVLVNARNIALVLFSVAFLGERCSNLQYLGYAIALGGLGLYNRAKHNASCDGTAAAKGSVSSKAKPE